MKIKALVTMGVLVALTPLGCGPSLKDGDGPPGIPQPAGHWTGVVTADNLNVRSGPGRDYYVCCRLRTGREVTVVGRQGDWLKILPPPGSISVIADVYVRPDSSGKIGTVTANSVIVRAWNLFGEDFGVIQCRMSRPQKVRIIGRVGKYYKIVPPKGAYFWTFAKHVDRAPQDGA